MTIAAEPSKLSEALAAAVGAEHVSSSDADRQAHAVDGLIPALVVRPGAMSRVAQALRAAAEAGAAVAVWGNGVRRDLGAPPRRLDAVVSLARLRSLVEYDAENLTVTAQAGMTLADLQTRLSERRQMLPLDPPEGGRQTLGGLCAVNAFGPRRSRYGSARDLVLGLRVALPNGEVIRAGGKTVKNVAGYDLCKLFIGSLGTLGAIVETTWRTSPRPEASASVVLRLRRGRWEEACDLGRELMGSVLEPAAVDVIGGPGARRCLDVAGLSEGGGEVLLVAAFEGAAAAVRRQVRETHRRRGGEGETVDEAAEQRLWRQLRRESRVRTRGQRSVTVRLSAPPAALAGLHDQAMATARAARRDFGYSEPTAVGRIGDGHLYLSWDVPPAAEGPAVAAVVEEWRAAAIELDGHAIVEAASAELKTGLDIWGPPGPSFALMHALKQRFDPRGALAPGRFLGGL
jgi:glycolate oxidase FAD binding subunit